MSKTKSKPKTAPQQETGGDCPSASCCASFVKMFKPQFAGLVERGEKLQTVRPTPKRMPKPGDKISLRAWSDKPYRSKQKLLNEGIITRVTRIEITNDGVTLLPETNMTATLRVQVPRGSFAVADGFSCWEEMRQWFDHQHGLPFEGVLISWHNVEVHTSATEGATPTQFGVCSHHSILTRSG